MTNPRPPRFPFLLLLLLPLPCCLALAACSTGARHGSDAFPAWVHEPTRTVENGYIIYVGSGEDPVAERAAFKAEATAIQDIASECSFAPKGTRVEDHFDDLYLGKHQAFSKIAVSFEDCEAAKAAQDPERIRALANVPMTEQLKHYQDLVYNPPEPSAESAAEGNAGAVNPALASTAAPPPISDEGHFLLIRQRVAYVKETVILAPPAAYPPASPQYHQIVSQLRPETQRLHDFEAANPHVRTWAHSWSGFERHPSVEIPRTLPRSKAFAESRVSPKTDPTAKALRSTGVNGSEDSARGGHRKKRKRRRRDGEPN